MQGALEEFDVHAANRYVTLFVLAPPPFQVREDFRQSEGSNPLRHGCGGPLQRPEQFLRARTTVSGMGTL